MAEEKLVPGGDGNFSVYLSGFKDKSNEEITEIFSKFGVVLGLSKVNNSHFIKYAHKEEAIKAIEEFANNHNVKVAPPIHKNKKREENKVSPRNNSEDHDNIMRGIRNRNDQGNMKSPPHDRQVQDTMEGNRHDYNEGRKYRNQNQENEKDVRNFQDQNDRKDNRIDQSRYTKKHRNIQNGLDDYSGRHNENHRNRRSDFKQNSFSKQDFTNSGDSNVQDDYNVGHSEKRHSRRSDDFKQNSFSKKDFASPRHSNVQDDYNEGHSENRRSRRSDDFKQNSFSKKDFASPRHSNVQDENQLCNGYSTDKSEKNDHKQLEKNSRKSQRYDNKSNKSCMHEEDFDDMELTNVAGNTSYHKNPKDNESKMRIAKEVIIADLPHGIMQADVYKLCDYVNPLHIDIHTIEGHDIYGTKKRNHAGVAAVGCEVSSSTQCGTMTCVFMVITVLGVLVRQFSRAPWRYIFCVIGLREDVMVDTSNNNRYIHIKEDITTRTFTQKRNVY